MKRLIPCGQRGYLHKKVDTLWTLREYLHKKVDTLWTLREYVQKKVDTLWNIERRIFTSKG